MLVYPASFRHLAQCITHIIKIACSRRYAKGAQCCQHMEFWIDPENDKGDKSKHYTREQAFDYEMAFAHPLRARHEQHPMLQIMEQIYIIFKAYSVEELMWNDRQ